MTKTFGYLLSQFLQEDISPEDLLVFLAAARQSENAEMIKAKLFQRLESKAYHGMADTGDMESRFQQMLAKADWITGNEAKIIEFHPSKKVFNTRRIAVAAAIILILGVGSYFLFFNKDGKKDEIVKTTQPANDVEAPKGTRAMITLGDGRQITIDSLSRVTQGNAQVVKTAEGKIVYHGSTTEVIYNTLSNPRGSKVIDMTLADGSHVWLNAGSSVTYPVAFIGNERKVHVTGEAYFDVAPSISSERGGKKKPFIVSKGETSVTVVGTHFNVNAYDDEADMKITLLEGSVKVASPALSRGGVILKPGQQAQVAEGIKVVDAINVEEVMAWKKGRFQFAGAGIEEVMRQIARWYDVDVVFEINSRDLHFSGSISREVKASRVFKMLEATGAVHFKIEGKKVYVIR